MADLPRLAFFYEQISGSVLEIFEAAQGCCRIVWVIGWSPDAPPVRTLARFGEVVDVTGMRDTEAVDHIVAARPDGVFVFDDSPLRLAAAVAERLSLRFHNPSTARLLTDKVAQRTELARAGVPGPRFWAVPANAASAHRARIAGEAHYPVVLKPQTGAGSRDTYHVPDAATLQQLLAGPRVGSEDMVLEEVLAEAHPRELQRFGDVLMVDSLVSAGHGTHFAVTGHFIPAEPFRGTGSFIPSHLDAAETTAVLEATDAALAALGIENGFTNTDLILTPAGPRVLEVNGRIGGQIPVLLGAVGSAPLLQEAMRFALHGPDGVALPPGSERVAFCAMYQPPTGAQRLVELGGLDAVAGLAGVTHVIPNRVVGDAIDWREGTLSRLFTAYGVVDDHDQLHQLYEEIKRLVVARYDMVVTDGDPGPPTFSEMAPTSG
jgi:hypothetical protein